MILRLLSSGHLVALVERTAGKTTLLRALEGTGALDRPIHVRRRPPWRRGIYATRAAVCLSAARATSVHWPLPARDIVALGAIRMRATARRADA